MTELHPESNAEYQKDADTEEAVNEEVSVDDVMKLLKGSKPGAILAAAKILEGLPAPVRQEGREVVVMSDEERIRMYLAKVAVVVNPYL